MQIDGTELKRGTKKSWTLPAGETAIGSYGIPITVISGLREGPTLAVMAGCHPGELVAIAAAIRISKQIDPSSLSGTLIIVHVQNPLGLQFKQAYVNPLDGMNLSGAYPHDEADSKNSSLDLGKSSVHRARSLTIQVAEKLFREIVKQSDYLVDMHGGELNESLVPNIEILMCGNKDIDERTRDFAKLFGFELVWELSTGGIPEMPNYPGPGMLVYEAVRSGIPAAYCECGREGKIEEEYVQKSFQGVRNLMIGLGMLGEEPKRSLNCNWLVGGSVIFAARAGLFVSFVKAGDMLRKGQELGYIMDIWGERLETFRSSVDGVLLNTITLGVANPGDMLYVIGSSGDSKN
ncbi:MAG TPA: succinylglutamate desuccinylase/aspartoacylase family protein [Nitrososphaerales archaeon]|nr:succinylglutamate desuccinylase/aspartoacylase family protein [Nitrososphaerales archaeon]